jgi:hypothetical protein
MKAYLKKSLLLTFAVLSLAACQKKEDSTAISTAGRVPRGAYDSLYANGANPNTKLVGKVVRASSEQDEFDAGVRGFLSSTLPEDYVGYVDAQGQYNTGVFFGGRVVTRGASGGYQIDPSSQIMIVVKDYFQNQTNVQPIAWYLSNASGQISGNTAIIRFQDALGYVELQGSFDQNYFEGDFLYDNNRRYDGSTPGAAGAIGHFVIPTCQFFVCQ